VADATVPAKPDGTDGRVVEAVLELEVELLLELEAMPNPAPM
jgi:hypothetical protein